MTPKKVLFFSPFSGIWLHAMPEALVAAQLRRSGAEVTYITCDGIFEAGCAVMSAHGLPPNADRAARAHICGICRKQRDLIVDALGVKSATIESLLDDEARVKVKAQVEAATLGNMATLEAEGLPVGRYALHETIIHFKLSDLSEITPASFAHFQVDLKHTLLALEATKQMLERFGPDCIVTYNTHYSLNYGMTNFAERHSVAVYGLHAGGNMARRLSSLYVFRRDMVRLYRDMMKRFARDLEMVPGDEAGIRGATDHFLALTFGGSVFVYSTPKSRKPFDVRRFFAINREQKVVLATLSSYDELFSSQILGVLEDSPMLFNNQVEWVDALVSWARTRPDVFLIIRVHPREFPNRRDAVHSTHAQRLATAFQDLPSNVRINWPTDEVSLYDLAAEVDVALNGWSSAGKELSLLGIPVVLFTRDILFYPASLNLLANNKSHYFSLIEEALACGWSFDRVRRTYRWLALEYQLATIDISDGFSFKEHIKPPSRLRRVYARLMHRLDPWRTQRRDTHALKRPLRHGAKLARAILDDVPVVALQMEDRIALSASDEDHLLREELHRILTQAYANTSSSSPLVRRLQQHEDGN